MSINEDIKKRLSKAVNIGLGLGQMAAEGINQALSGLEKEGKINRAEGKRLAKDLIGEVNAFQKKLSQKIDKGVSHVVKSSGVKKSSKKKRG